MEKTLQEKITIMEQTVLSSHLLTEVLKPEQKVIETHEEVKNLKKCKKCDEFKDINSFIKDSSRKSGVHPYCRICQNKIKNNKRTLERSLKWQKENKEKRKEIRKKWRDKNPELTRFYRHKRRKLVIDNSDGTVTPESIKTLPKLKCAICGCDLKTLKSKDVHLDHTIPLAADGLHSITNLQWTCATCNLSKGRKLYNG